MVVVLTAITLVFNLPGKLMDAHAAQSLKHYTNINASQEQPSEAFICKR